MLVGSTEVGKLFIHSKHNVLHVAEYIADSVVSNIMYT